MPAYYRLLDFECPRCGHIDEEVKVSEEKLQEAMDENMGYVDHTCSRCECNFKQQE